MPHRNSNLISSYCIYLEMHPMIKCRASERSSERSKRKKKENKRPLLGYCFFFLQSVHNNTKIRNSDKKPKFYRTYRLIVHLIPHIAVISNTNAYTKCKKEGMNIYIQSKRTTCTFKCNSRLIATYICIRLPYYSYRTTCGVCLFVCCVYVVTRTVKTTKKMSNEFIGP